MGSHHFPIKIVLCLTQNLCRPPGSPKLTTGATRDAPPERVGDLDKCGWILGISWDTDCG